MCECSVTMVTAEEHLVAMTSLTGDGWGRRIEDHRHVSLVMSASLLLWWKRGGHTVGFIIFWSRLLFHGPISLLPEFFLYILIIT